MEEDGGGDHLPRRRISLQERLGLSSSSSCGSPSSTMIISIQGQQEQEQEHVETTVETFEHLSDVLRILPDCISPSPRMNLATALAAERQSRSTGRLTFDHHENTLTSSTVDVTPARVSLMRLLEETDDQDEKEEEVNSGLDLMCCVCMGRKKGAAFIPCGHTFCRVCSRELWLNRGSCPLCNRSILDILDIF